MANGIMPVERHTSSDWMEYLPHGPAMRMLEQVTLIDEDQIRCTVIRHRDPSNPMRQEGRLGSACGLEIAAQAMALHSIWLAMKSKEIPSEEKKGGGMLTSVRDLNLSIQRLDDIAQDLNVHAIRQAGDDRGALYSFEICAPSSGILVSGRASFVQYLR
jgi:predicted hotdog family 3-hydroxylacyl-ACP dehydratase